MSPVVWQLSLLTALRYKKPRSHPLPVWFPRLMPAPSVLGFFPRTVSLLLHRMQVFQHPCDTEYHAASHPHCFIQAVPLAWNNLPSLLPLISQGFSFSISFP